jgi:hypothetical protein
LAGPALRLDYGLGGGEQAALPGGKVTLYGEARFPVSASCDFQYLLLSVPEGWVVPGRGLLSREGVAKGVFGQYGDERIEEIFPAQEEDDRYLLLRFIPNGPAGLDGFLHFNYVDGAALAYDPKTGAATFTVILQISRLESRLSVPVAARGLSLCRRDKGTGQSLFSTEKTGLAVAVAAESPAAGQEAFLEIAYLDKEAAEEFFPTGAREAADFREDREEGILPEQDGVLMDFPALGRGDRVIALTFPAPDREKGGVFYDGVPASAEADGTIALGGEFFQPGKISFRAANAWSGLVRLGFIAVVRHDPSGAERELTGSVSFLSASRKKTALTRAAGSLERQPFFPVSDPSLFRELPREGEQESGPEVWSAFTLLSLSDCLAQDAEDISADLLPRRAYLQEYRIFSGTLAEEVVPLDVFGTEYSAPAGFRLNGLEFDPASLLGQDEDYLPLPVVAAYAPALGSFLPGGGVFGGFGAGFWPAEEQETPPLSDEEGLRVWFGGQGTTLRGDFLLRDSEIDLSGNFH